MGLATRRRGLDGLSARLIRHERALDATLVAAQVAGMLTSVIVARSVGPSGRGTVAIVTTWGQLLGWLAALSLDKALIVIGSERALERGPDDVLRAARVPIVGTSLLALLASWLLGAHMFSNLWLSAALGSLAVATSQAELVGGWLLATGRRRPYLLWRLLQPVAYLIMAVLVAAVLHSAAAKDRTTFMSVAAAASLLLPTALALRLMPRRPSLRASGVRAVMGFGLRAHVAIVLQYVNARLDLLTLAFLVQPQSLGYYAAGSAVGQLTMLTASAGFIRGITGDRSSHDLGGLACAMGLAVLVALLAPVAVPLVFGASFGPAVPIAQTLAIGGVFNYALLSAGGQLLKLRRPWSVAVSEGAGAAAFAVGMARFPTIQGAAWSSVVSFAVALAVARLFLRSAEPRLLAKPT